MAALSNSGRYCMYLRKSRADEMKEQLGEFETLSRHQDELYALADRLGIKVAKVFREIVSGESIDERPEMLQLINEVRLGLWDGVLTFEIERLTRGDATDQGTVGRAFMYSNTLIITPMKIYDPLVDSDMEYFEMGLFMSRHEYRSITRRLQSGRRKSAKEGQYMGSIAPFGWRKIDIDGKHTLEPDEKMAPWLKFIYEEIASERMTARAVATYLNQAGIPTPRNKHWDKKTVVNLVKNPINKGYVRWANQKTVTILDENMHKAKKRVKNNEADPDKMTLIVKGIHEGQIPDELWDKANQILESQYDASAIYGRSVKNIFAGLAKCSKCGRTLSRGISGGQDRKRRGKEYHFLMHPYSNRHECNMASCSMKTMIELVVGSLREISANLEVELNLDQGDSVKLTEKRISAANRELVEQRQSIDNLFRLVEKGMISDEEFFERKTTIQEDIASIEQSISDLENVKSQKQESLHIVTTIHQALEMIQDYRGNEEAVNLFLKKFIDRIEYTRLDQSDKPELVIYLK